jgi:hypothetical protein
MNRKFLFLRFTMQDETDTGNKAEKGTSEYTIQLR